MTLMITNMNEGYKELCEHVDEWGTDYRVRGLYCREVRPLDVRVQNPRRCIYTGSSRKLNYRFLAIEFLLHAGGLENAGLLESVAPNMTRFINPETRQLDGAYGPRLRQSLNRIYDLLREDFFTRQAVASIWSPTTLADFVGSRDVPCTLSLQFLGNEINGTKFLSMQASMRSNDLNWGVPYDFAAFSGILCLMADLLKVPVGRYYHTAGSMHYYHDNQPKLVSAESETYLPIGDSIPRLIGYDSMAEFQADCYKVIWHIAKARLYETLDWKEIDIRAIVTAKSPAYWGFWENLIKYNGRVPINEGE